MITLRNKIGQMLVFGFEGFMLHDKSPVAEWLSADGLGGVLLFDHDATTGLYGKNLNDQAQIKQLIHQLNHYSSKISHQNNALPLFIAIDYEGGAIDRLSKIEDCLPTISASEMTRLSPETLQAELIQMAFTLKTLGFNLNFAPVVDLKLENEQGIIGALNRSFSKNPEEVAHFAKIFVEIFSRHGIVCCYKHFPGHGSTLGDTHKGFVDVTNTFRSEELTPYYKLVAEGPGAAMIMTAHVVNKHLDNKGIPATLSHEILTGVLRQSIHYDGVVIADDLQMQAITDHYSLEDALCLTINAGADMIIFANQMAKITPPEVIEVIERLILEQKIEIQRVEEAYRRIIRLKHHLMSLN